MSNDKLTYFIDLDGTLFDQNKISRISTKNWMAISILKNFANVVFSTGRSFLDQRVKQTLHQFNLGDIITCSGAEIYINNQLVSQKLIEEETIGKIVNFAKERKILFVVFDKKGETIYTYNWFEYGFCKLFLSKKLHAVRKAEKFDLNRHINITKIAFILKRARKCSKLLKEFQLKLGNLTNSYAASANYVIEITNINANKGLSTLEYCNLTGTLKENTIHIGDSMSDVALKGYVGKLVAMGNSTPDLKLVADELAPNYKKGGLYKYFVLNKTKDKKDEK